MILPIFLTVLALGISLYLYGQKVQDITYCIVGLVFLSVSAFALVGIQFGNFDFAIQYQTGSIIDNSGSTYVVTATYETFSNRMLGIFSVILVGFMFFHTWYDYRGGYYNDEN